MTSTRDEATPPPLPVRATSLWEFQTDAGLTAVDLDRRSGNVLVADKAGALYLLDASGTVRTRQA